MKRGSCPCLLLVGLAALAGCRGQRPVERAAWSPVAPGALTDVQQGQLSRATAARDALFASLSARLATSFDAHGAAGSIGVCKDEAPRIAADVAREHGLAIGRTSKRLRNPDNVPPGWAAEQVAGEGTQTALFVGPQERLGVLLPIRTASLCTACHGRPESLAEDVSAALRARYPEDRAVGFGEGDLRGWFWIEVPGG